MAEGSFRYQRFTDEERKHIFEWLLILASGKKKKVNGDKTTYI